MNLVYGSSSSSYIDWCFSVMSDYYFDGELFVYPRAPPSVPPSLNSSSLKAPSAVHHIFRMSSRRLPVILFVSHIEFIFISCCLLRGVPVVAGRGCYIVCVISHVSNLRLVHSLLLIILLLPPPCALRTRLLFADSSVDCYCSCLSCFHSMTVSCPSGLCLPASLLLVTSQARLESDVLDPHPGSTAGYHHQLQALGGPDRSPSVPYDVPQ